MKYKIKVSGDVASQPIKGRVNWPFGVLYTAKRDHKGFISLQQQIHVDIHKRISLQVLYNEGN